MSPEAENFDRFAKSYDEALQKGLDLSGESKDFFAEGRIAWTAGLMEKQGIKIQSVLDYGCGTGTATPYLEKYFPQARIHGVDPSSESIAVARTRFQTTHAQFGVPDETAADLAVDLVYCNGVFHHIPIRERPGCVSWIQQHLKPGGHFALWENNPFNPGTRWVMSRIPFDRDAILLSPGQARRLLIHQGLNVIRTDFLFIFPKFLSGLRWIEPRLARWPLGAQYGVLSQKP